MAMIDLFLIVTAFIALWASSRAIKTGQIQFCSALLFSHQNGAQVARQRCPILRFDFKILSPGLFSRKEDVSTLQKLGHLYFALTEHRKGRVFPID